MVFNGSGPPNPSHLTPQPQPFAPASNEITTTMPTSSKQLGFKLGNSVTSGALVPIQPKLATKDRSNELPPTSDPQDSSLLLFPSQETLVYRPASSVSRGKRKRLRSPPARPSDIPKDAPEDCFHVFRMIEQSDAANDKDQQQPVTKRTRSARTRLRCQMQKLKVTCDYTPRRAGWADTSVVLGRFALQQLCGLVWTPSGKSFWTNAPVETLRRLRYFAAESFRRR